MQARCGRMLAVGLVLVVLLAGCATTMARQDDSMGMPNAQTPDYLAHPFRIVALGGQVIGQVLQYAVVEPIAFALNEVPDAVGLSLEERRYLEQRKEAWKKFIDEQKLTH
jgi:hypothetical protein